MINSFNIGSDMKNSILDEPATKRDIENLRQELIGKMATKDELKNWQQRKS